MVGTPKNTEMRSASIRSATSAGSNLGTTTCVMARAVPANSTRVSWAAW